MYGAGIAGSVTIPSRVNARALVKELNGARHSDALLALAAIIAAYSAEHIFQAVQVFVLGWPRVQALGALGLLFPVLVTSEWLHYIFAVVTLVALVALRPGFGGRAVAWWNAALAIQIWHHFEHALLLGQVLTQTNLFGASVPTSMLQLVVPRVELHLAYNALVLIPMGVAITLHRRETGTSCTCPRSHARVLQGAQS